MDTAGSDIHGAVLAAGRINQISITLVMLIKTSHLLDEGVSSCGVDDR